MKITPAIETAFERACEAQILFWDSISELEQLTGLEIDGTHELHSLENLFEED